MQHPIINDKVLLKLSNGELSSGIWNGFSWVFISSDKNTEVIAWRKVYELEADDWVYVG